VFFVESEEKIAICPNCGNPLIYHSRIIRSLLDISGTKKRYSLRVLKCENEACPTTYHRELPDSIIPYKRYDAQSIQDAIEGENTIVAADESTIYRWRKWFETNSMYMKMALLGVLAMLQYKDGTSSLSIEKHKTENQVEDIKIILSLEERWLGAIVRILVNSSRWIFNRSAFLSG